jgi:hypothetical protein
LKTLREVRADFKRLEKLMKGLKNGMPDTLQVIETLLGELRNL